MRALFDFLDNYVYGPLNYIDRGEGLIKAIIYQDSGHRFAIPRVDKGGKYNLRQIENLLTRYGVAVYSRTYDAKCRYFRVKKRQARWAEYVMLHAGVELLGPLFDEQNPHYVSQHPPGWMPQPWSEQNEDTADDTKLLSTAAEDETGQQADSDNGWNVLKKLVYW
ncbi:MAG: hypothetical protein R2932_08880 [Caldilineaceae bacterium]